MSEMREIVLYAIRLARNRYE